MLNVIFSRLILLINRYLIMQSYQLSGQSNRYRLWTQRFWMQRYSFLCVCHCMNCFFFFCLILSTEKNSIDRLNQQFKVSSFFFEIHTSHSLFVLKVMISSKKIYSWNESYKWAKPKNPKWFQVKINKQE